MNDAASELWMTLAWCTLRSDAQMPGSLINDLSLSMAAPNGHTETSDRQAPTHSPYTQTLTPSP